MNFYEKRETAFKIMEILKAGNLNDYQKKQIYDIVMSLGSKTIKQKDRFVKLYNLDPTKNQKYTKASLAREYQCTSSAITSSIISVQGSLFRIPDDKVLILQKIIKECQK